MKSNLITRTITAVIGIIIFLIVALSSQTVLNIANAIVVLLMLFEVYFAFNFPRPLAILGSIGSVFIVYSMYIGNLYLFLGCFVLFCMLLILYLLINSNKIKFSSIATMIFITIYVACFMFYISKTRALDNGHFYLFLIFTCAWLNDTFAYFFGKAFGKQKLAENISPKKTLEGAAGGFLGSITGAVLLGLIAQIFFNKQANYIVLVAVGLICGPLAVMGDLIASVMKRECKIKDFGSIVPGHGGVMDRFDSVVLIAPFIYYTITLLSKISVYLIK